MSNCQFQLYQKISLFPALLTGYRLCQNLESIKSSKNILLCISCNISLCNLQSFGGSPSVIVSAKYARSTKSNDAMYVWLENVNSGSFEVCIREFLPFDGKHQDTIVVRFVNVFSKRPLMWLRIETIPL